MWPSQNANLEFIYNNQYFNKNNNWKFLMQISCQELANLNLCFYTSFKPSTVRMLHSHSCRLLSYDGEDGSFFFFCKRIFHGSFENEGRWFNKWIADGCKFVELSTIFLTSRFRQIKEICNICVKLSGY